MSHSGTHHWQLVQKALRLCLQRMAHSRQGIHRGWSPSPTSPLASRSPAWGSLLVQCTLECHTPAQVNRHRWVLGNRNSCLHNHRCCNFFLLHSKTHLFVNKLSCVFLHVTLVQVGGHVHQANFRQTEVRQFDVAHGCNQQTVGWKKTKIIHQQHKQFSKGILLWTVNAFNKFCNKYKRLKSPD